MVSRRNGNGPAALGSTGVAGVVPPVPPIPPGLVVGLEPGLESGCNLGSAPPGEASRIVPEQPDAAAPIKAIAKENRITPLDRGRWKRQCEPHAGARPPVYLSLRLRLGTTIISRLQCKLYRVAFGSSFSAKRRP